MAMRKQHEEGKSEGAVPENGDVAAGASQTPDVLHSEITAALKEKVAKMFQEARDNKNSEASEMVHMILLNQLTKLGAQPSEKEFKAIIGEEHRRQSFREHWKLSIDREAHARKTAEERLELLREKLKLEKGKVRDARKRNRDAQDIAEEAKAAAEQGQPMDALSVYNRIAQIVGLHSPLKPIGLRAEPQVESDSK